MGIMLAEGAGKVFSAPLPANDAWVSGRRPDLKVAEPSTPCPQSWGFERKRTEGHPQTPGSVPLHRCGTGNDVLISGNMTAKSLAVRREVQETISCTSPIHTRSDVSSLLGVCRGAKPFCVSACLQDWEVKGGSRQSPVGTPAFAGMIRAIGGFVTRWHRCQQGACRGAEPLCVYCHPPRVGDQGG
jgi:hypothetical protein